ncbi:MAG: hypothetical protein MUC69_02450 [Gemmatimonadales bacterium]|nr:hypothetical protein [Gemmatimonadales bacterium]
MRTRWFDSFRLIGGLALVATMTTTTACDDDDDDVELPSTVYTITVESGADQTAVLGTALPDPIALQVLDEQGDPVEIEVTWAVQNGGGSLGAPSTTTGTDGRTSNSFTLGPVSGTQTIKATVVGSNPVASVLVSATATVGP